MERMAGVILHPSSFPSDFGIGNFGASAYKFIDFLNASGFRLWQFCPLGPTGYGDSPYQSFSAFAGNPYFIDWQLLIDTKLISKSDLRQLEKLSKNKVNYGKLYKFYWPVIEKAFYNYKHQYKKSKIFPLIDEFYHSNSSWIFDYSNFRNLKDKLNQEPREKWPEKFRTREKSNKLNRYIFHSINSEKHAFTQYLFYKQYNELRKYANKLGVNIIGDIPIFISNDSADAWSDPNLFDLNQNGIAENVAGVPPDYFSKSGQLWGNPLYKWENHLYDDFKWWINRINHNFKLYDYVRIDHFRGFESCYSIKASEKTAKNGKWITSPGNELFNQLKKTTINQPIIAEDLGIITPNVKKLLHDSGFPGMAVLHFAFNGDPENPYLPHNLKKRQVVYSCTHDNNTSIGWFESLDDSAKSQIKKYLNISGDNIGWDLFNVAIESISDFAIVPMQDLMKLGQESRLNTPGRASGNWNWRYSMNDLNSLKCKMSHFIREKLTKSGRL